MNKSITRIVSLILIAAVVTLALYALGVIAGDGTSKARDKDYAEFTFTGNLRNGLFTGYGVMSFATGERYSGNFAAGRFDGEGTFSCASNDWSFYGIFQEGQITGGVIRTDGDAIAFERGETADALTGRAWR